MLYIFFLAPTGAFYASVLASIIRGLAEANF